MSNVTFPSWQKVPLHKKKRCLQFISNIILEHDKVQPLATESTWEQNCVKNLASMHLNASSCISIYRLFECIWVCCMQCRFTVTIQCNAITHYTLLISAISQNCSHQCRVSQLYFWCNRSHFLTLDHTWLHLITFSNIRSYLVTFDHIL